MQEKPRRWAERINRLGRLMGRYEQAYMGGVISVGVLAVAIMFVLR